MNHWLLWEWNHLSMLMWKLRYVELFCCRDFSHPGAIFLCIKAKVWDWVWSCVLVCPSKHTSQDQNFYFTFQFQVMKRKTVYRGTLREEIEETIHYRGGCELRCVSHKCGENRRQVLSSAMEKWSLLQTNNKLSLKIYGATKHVFLFK